MLSRKRSARDVGQHRYGRDSGLAHRRAESVGAQAVGARAIGTLALGALANGKLAIGRARVERLEIDELVVWRLRIIEQLQVPPDRDTES